MIQGTQSYLDPDRAVPYISDADDQANNAYTTRGSRDGRAIQGMAGSWRWAGTFGLGSQGEPSLSIQLVRCCMLCMRNTVQGADSSARQRVPGQHLALRGRGGVAKQVEPAPKYSLFTDTSQPVSTIPRRPLRTSCPAGNLPADTL